MGKRMCIAAMAAAWAMLGASAMQVFAADKVPASAPVSGPASSAGGYFRSDRTMEDIKEAEAALKEQWQKDSKAAGSRFKGGGTWTDLNGYAWKYGLTLPAKVGAMPHL